MNIRNISLWVLALGCALSVTAQENKRTMTFDDLVSWKRISDKTISNNGKWVAVQVEPWEGNSTVQLFQAKGKEAAVFPSASRPMFTPSGKYLLVTEKPTKEVLDSLKLRKVKKDKFPKNNLIIYNNVSGDRQVVDSVKSYKISEWGDWIAWQRDVKDSVLYLRKAEGGQPLCFPSVTDYKFSKEGNTLLYVSQTGKERKKSGVYTFRPQTASSVSLYEGPGEVKKAAVSKAGDRVAFILDSRPDSTATSRLSLWFSDGHAPAKKIAEEGNEAFSAGWVINEYTQPYFSDNGERLFFATYPRPLQKDTTVLDEYRPKVHIWNWQEEKQYTQQLIDKDQDRKKGYLATYHPASGKITQPATLEVPDITLARKGDAPFALASTIRPYSREQMWEGRSLRDIYKIDFSTGKKDLLKKAFIAPMRLSPEGKYSYWYNPQDSSWYARSLDTEQEVRLTDPSWFKAYDEDNDVPDYPDSYGIAGWTENDDRVLIYDKYDIWEFDPAGVAHPENLTVNGRSRNQSYRLIKLDKEQTHIDTRHPQLLSMFDYTRKGSGYYSAKLASPAKPKELLAGDFLLKTPIKAKDSDAVIYTAETFERFPDILLSDLRFKKSVQLTHVNPQQSDINWGTAELVKWTSLDGTPLEGVVYKPADFDSTRQYPMIVNFYERNADNYHAYRQPEPHRSTIDYHFYNSNGYVIFNPDVRYKDGHPGQSAYNSIIPGVDMLLERGYIDPRRIGAQGHSWGGYQVAELATRTPMFAAIESGAPVVNMFSAYGGIRWGTGRNRSFQYEHGQSRIGKSPWEAAELYWENSPLFNMDKVQTPILIMANDNDGHVPWYQGIEYFVALKRLNKPVWLLNYTGEPHWPMRMANRIDFQKRMFQFFQHYLNGKPMPLWMEEGVPAVEQEYKLGYE